MSSRLAGLFVHCLHVDDSQGSWSGKDSITYNGMDILIVLQQFLSPCSGSLDLIKEN